jgi:hypothetical protein
VRYEELFSSTMRLLGKDVHLSPVYRGTYPVSVIPPGRDPRPHHSFERRPRIDRAGQREGIRVRVGVVSSVGDVAGGAAG